jgi:hypothetical protein
MNMNEQHIYRMTRWPAERCWKDSAEFVQCATVERAGFIPKNIATGPALAALTPKNGPEHCLAVSE